MNDQILVQKCIDFIQQNTLVQVRETNNRLSHSSHSGWDGVRLSSGVLEINPKVVHPGDLLHECGHVVTVPLSLRPEMSGWLGCWEWEPRLARHVELFGDGLHASDDSAATYWGCMALLAMGESIDPMFENGFSGLGDLDGFQAGVWFGMESKTPTHPSVAAYYAGLTTSKAEVTPIAWDIALIENN